MYIKMSEISNFWLSVLILQVAPYLMFILVSKSTHPVSLVLSSQNAQLLLHIRSTISTGFSMATYGGRIKYNVAIGKSYLELGVVL